MSALMRHTQHDTRGRRSRKRSANSFRAHDRGSRKRSISSGGLSFILRYDCNENVDILNLPLEVFLIICLELDRTSYVMMARTCKRSYDTLTNSPIFEHCNAKAKWHKLFYISGTETNTAQVDVVTHGDFVRFYKRFKRHNRTVHASTAALLEEYRSKEDKAGFDNKYKACKTLCFASAMFVGFFVVLQVWHFFNIDEITERKANDEAPFDAGDIIRFVFSAIFTCSLCCCFYAFWRDRLHDMRGVNNDVRGDFCEYLAHFGVLLWILCIILSVVVPYYFAASNSEEAPQFVLAMATIVTILWLFITCACFAVSKKAFYLCA